MSDDFSRPTPLSLVICTSLFNFVISKNVHYRVLLIKCISFVILKEKETLIFSVIVLIKSKTMITLI